MDETEQAIFETAQKADSLRAGTTSEHAKELLEQARVLLLRAASAHHNTQSPK
jgi:predicted metal-dependent phosphotriesterase family hydrolase